MAEKRLYAGKPHVPAEQYINDFNDERNAIDQECAELLHDLYGDEDDGW